LFVGFLALLHEFFWGKYDKLITKSNAIDRRSIRISVRGISASIGFGRFVWGWNLRLDEWFDVFRIIVTGAAKSIGYTCSSGFLTVQFNRFSIDPIQAKALGKFFQVSASLFT
jgi:hypothetical protein